MSAPLDPTKSFATLVIGPGNQLAMAAARRSAESLGTYNPLVLFGPPGVGKTHLLHAIGQRAMELHPKLNVVFETLEAFTARLNEAVAKGQFEGFRTACMRIDLLLLDGAETLAGKPRLQNELLPIWDRMGQHGGQVVLASDIAPAQIDGLNTRLEARFARVLAVEIRAPDSTPHGGAVGLHRSTAAPLPRLEPAAAASAEHVPAVDSGSPWSAGPATLPVPVTEEDPFDSFLSDITSTLEEVVDSAPWKNLLAETILRWGGEGLRTWRLEAALENETAPDVAALIRGYEADAARLKQIAVELAEISPGLASSAVLRDPDRLDEAEALLWGARLEQQPVPQPPADQTLADFGGRDGVESAAVALARRIAAGTAGEHNPVLVYGPAGRCTHYLAGIGNAAAAARPGLRIAFLSGLDLARELASALRADYPDLWRRRYEGIDLFLLDGLDALVIDDRAQEVLYVLIDTLLHRGMQVVLSAQEPLRRIRGLHARFAQRLEAGLAIDLSGTATRRLFSRGSHVAAAAVRAAGPDTWFFDVEKIAWDWVALDDRLPEELN